MALFKLLYDVMWFSLAAVLHSYTAVASEDMAGSSLLECVSVLLAAVIGKLHYIIMSSLLVLAS